ncbi:uncharacterized protein LOC118648635 [Monomorium pharaonis]|uniref:uncharacterized protein LOC118646329 n=1 Tax=Monomorium pharaonis TaxID=307658 RepID=UPI0017465ACB|nr:uncharacterized protein LOC118646329 [Monomorium pharaonis]XP_036150878.1 uncharacterized protein LOC118648635 [Monomorium pharaonis]
MLYGSTLRLPGEFFIDEDLPADPEIFIEKHREHMRLIKSRPTAHHCKTTPFHHPALSDCSHVWLREDCLKKSLQPPYSGPFRVVKRVNEYLFTIDIAGKIVNVSTERLKPAFLPKEIPLDHLAVSFPATSSIPSVLPSRPLRTYCGPKKKVRFAT